MQNQNEGLKSDTTNRPVTVPIDVKQYDAPIKKMENESAYREWLDRSKLVVPANEITAEKNNPAPSQDQPAFHSSHDEVIMRDLNALLTTHHDAEAMDLKVHVYDGEVVVMGLVPDRNTMEQIIALAEKSSGVQSVINRIRICDGSITQPAECITKFAGKSEFSSTTSKLLTSALAGAASLFKPSQS